MVETIKDGGKKVVKVLFFFETLFVALASKVSQMHADVNPTES